MRGVAIVSPVRTAVGSFGGSLKDISAAELGSIVIKAVLEQTSLDPEKIDDVILGHGYASGEEPAIEVAMEDEAQLPIASYWVCVSTNFEIILTRTQQQVTRLIITRLRG